jgi:seryl-tRNA synthetase
MSFNYHQDHFASLWGIELTSGEAAHTACIGFGMERLALALFRRHGLDIGDWPPSVRAALEF